MTTRIVQYGTSQNVLKTISFRWSKRTSRCVSEVFANGLGDHWVIMALVKASCCPPRKPLVQMSLSETVVMMPFNGLPVGTTNARLAVYQPYQRQYRVTRSSSTRRATLFRCHRSTNWITWDFMALKSRHAVGRYYWTL